MDPSETSTEKLVSTISLVSTGIILLGALFPIFQFKFSPPQGYAVINGMTVYSFNYTMSLPFPIQGLASTFDAMRAAIFGLVIGNVLIDLPIILLKSESMIEFLVHPVIQILFGAIKSFAVGIQTIAFLGFFVLYTNHPQLTSFLTRSPSEYNALPYYHPSLDFGFYIIAIGFVIAFFIAIKNLGLRIAGFLLLSMFFLFLIGAFTGITALFELLNRLDPLQLFGL